jgi:hypothetical protein
VEEQSIAETLYKLKKNKKNNKAKRNKKRSSLGAVFDKHIRCEFQDHDVDATMKTMVREPYVHHVPMMTGGIGYDSVYNFKTTILLARCQMILKYTYHVR